MDSRLTSRLKATPPPTPVGPIIGKGNKAKHFRNLLGPWLYTFILFGGLLLVVTRSMGPPFGILLGPYAGAHLRDWQSCCAENSNAIAPAACLGVVLALIIQTLLSRSGYFPRVFGRLAAWTAPIIWFLYAILSYGHALE